MPPSSAAEHAGAATADVGPLAALHTGHPLLAQARQLVPQPAPGARLVWWREALAQDLASAAYRARENSWAVFAAPLLLD